MNIEQAIKHGQEQLDIFGGEHKEFVGIAIKSLDMWDKVIEELEKLRYNGDFKITYSDCIKRVLDIIEKYKKEIEE